MIAFRPTLLALAVGVCTCVSSESALVPRYNPGKIWVTVDTNGDAQTITPSMSGTRTISGAPEYVTQTSVYALTTAEGMVQTSTGMAPVATATAPSGAGAFFQCRNLLGLDAPFCQPRRGSLLRPGNTYYVTWNVVGFASEDSLVAVQVRYSDNTGFVADKNVTVSTGFYIWNIDQDILSQGGRDGGDLVATLSLIEVQTSGNGSESSLAYSEGPSVTISRSASPYSSPENSPKNHGGTVAIAVSVTILAVLFIFASFVVWSWKRHGRIFGIGGRRNRPDSQRTNSLPNFGRPEDKSRQVELTDRGSWVPASNKNVFRAEIQRQEMERGY
ncbi:hypothetical protein KVR01_011055 [Diaporthe batatas]|uniref:uncharacterized protein n=1 Tax=Diaporthe batatas TaxID=748121 RepID=UPI001D045DEC|nr:uncharacterized protein KVR01_011055 [Diaporthe batatas]KAG8159394.1 hypothetical protein KVR01_011055 [Diaporthe batatas]